MKGPRQLGTSHREPLQIIGSHIRFAKEISMQEFENTDENRKRFKFFRKPFAKRFWLLQIKKQSGQIFEMAISYDERRHAKTRARKRGVLIS